MSCIAAPQPRDSFTKAAISMIRIKQEREITASVRSAFGSAFHGRNKNRQKTLSEISAVLMLFHA